MTDKRIYLWRHGRTAYNRQGRIQGQIDIPLDRTGVRQADLAGQALAQLLSAERIPPLLVSSDLQRAAGTARTLAERMNLDLMLDPAFREKGFGPWEGLTRQEIIQGWPSEGQAWIEGTEPADVPIERREAVSRRVNDALTKWSQQTVPGQALIIASHGSIIRTAVSELLGFDEAHKAALRVMENAHWASLEHTTDELWGLPGWRLTSYNQGPVMPLSRWREQTA